MKRLLAAVGMVVLLAASQSWANIIFTFSGATFSDGGTLTGTFTTDNTATALVDYNILTAGGALPGFNYTPATAISLSSLPFILVLEPAAGDPILQVTFAGGLTPLGAAITIGQFDSFEQVGVEHREITAGSVAPAPSVPEPGTLLLLGAAMIGAGALRRRQQRT